MGNKGTPEESQLRWPHPVHLEHGSLCRGLIGALLTLTGWQECAEFPRVRSSTGSVELSVCLSPPSHPAACHSPHCPASSPTFAVESQEPLIMEQADEALLEDSSLARKLKTGVSPAASSQTAICPDTVNSPGIKTE